MINLPRGKNVVLKAEDKDYDRGLVVKLLEGGGYDVYYWYDDPKKVYPAEIKIDGKSITKDGKIVHIGLHPELKKDENSVNEDGHKDKPSAIRKLKVSIENAEAILKALESNDGELMTWWMDKITLANDYLSKAKDFIDNPVQEAVYKLKPGSVANDLDELDAMLSRMKILGKPDFSKLTYAFKGNKRQNIKVDKIMKKLKHKKIKEGFASDAQRRAAFASGYKAKGKKKKKEGATPKTQPNYYKGLSKKDKEERQRVIKRRTKMDSDDPKAYKAFRSDKGVKTKPSKWTAKFKKMYGEMNEDQKNVFHEKLSAKIRKSLRNKAKKANAPTGALTTVYNKGLAAWRTGHRPGASQHAWAMGRVNSFLAGGPARKVDKAQWNQVKKHRKK